MLKALAPYTWAAVLAAGIAIGWWGGSTVEELACAEAQRDADRERDRLVEDARRQERAAWEAKQQSSGQIDSKDAEREVDVQYVDREVVKYVTKYRDRGCPVLPERVCIYNQALGIPCRVPEAPGA